MQPKISLIIDLSEEGTLLHPFWKSTGYSPGLIALREDMQQTLEWIGSMAGDGIEFIRPHYMLDLVAVEGIETETPTYNWSRLNEALDVHVENGLKLIFELMGYPSSDLGELGGVYDDAFQERSGGAPSYFTDFSTDDQLQAWKRLVRDLALHYIKRYGIETVRSWYFETWNEPNAKNFWGHGLEAFKNYYDACSEGLKEADSQIRFGGPGTIGGLIYESWGTRIVEHAARGTNYFTGETGVRMDFISFHIKTLPDQMLDATQGCQRTFKAFPELEGTPIFNDESDPYWGWSKTFWWHRGPWYPACMARAITLHQNAKLGEDAFPYALMSNDHAFMGAWGNRTLHTRFQAPEGDGFSLVKKPAHMLMSLLGMLPAGETLTLSFPEAQAGVLDGFVVKALEEINILLTQLPVVPDFNKHEVLDPTPEQVAALQAVRNTVEIGLKNLKLKSPRIAVYAIDQAHGNPFRIWDQAGRPEIPTTEDLRAMRAHQEPVLVELYDLPVAGATAPKLKFELGQSATRLVRIFEKTNELPGRPASLSMTTYPGLHGPELLLKWSAPELGTRVKSYEVFYSENANEPGRMISDTIFSDTAFLWAPDQLPAHGWLSVRAVDYWDRSSEFSDPLEIR